MELPETNPNIESTPSSAPKMDGAGRANRSYSGGSGRPSSAAHRRERADEDFDEEEQSESVPGQNPEQNQHEQPSAAQQALQTLNQSHDPRQIAANLADKYLHLGSQVGFALFIVWGILAFFTLPTVIIGTGLISGAIFNILLFSPKTVYRLTEGILDFVGFGEILQAVDKVGLDKVNIEIKDWMKAIIILYDIIIALGILFLIVVVLMSICYISNGVVSDVIGKASDLYNGANTYASINAFCSSFTK